MASSSSSSQEKYDVFLSFRGEDTRFGFTSNLYHVLRKKGIQTYMDNQELESGHEISPQLKQAIQESNICIIVLSKNFASSTWCLNELVHILECKGNENVIPIFYLIDPSIVRKQLDSYAVAFEKHEQRFKDKMEKVKQWRGALEKLPNLCGYDSKNFRDEHELVGKIAEDILWKLPKYQLKGYGHIFGIEEHVKKIESLLSIGEMDVRIIGIWGMGGIGKTSLAEIVFQRCSYSYFDGCCFVEDIPEGADNTSRLRQDLLSALLEDKNLVRMNTPSVGSPYIQERLRHKKVLIVLDNLNGRSSKLNDLFEGYQLANGSRIIVTSRDKQLLETNNCQIYPLNGLCHHDALQLFCFHAFAPNSPATGYEDLLESVAHFAQGNPLALKVLGSSLKCKSVKEWKSALDKLKTDPDPDIQKVLRISYDGLGDKSIQGIFLDIACFFNNQAPREEVESILNHTDATIGISVLIDKSLIGESGGILRMHDLLLQMARSIVYDENKDCGNRSRLWKNKDSCHVLERNTGTSVIEGISLNLSQLRKDVKVSRMAFSKMSNLRILKLHWDDGFDYRGEPNWRLRDCNFRLSLPDELEPFVSYELKYFQWDAYPLKYLPYFNLENLVQLIMRESQLELLWNEDERLMQIPNLSRAINLQVLNLQGCKSLVQLPSFFKNLGKLRFLHLRNCDNLEDGLENLPIQVRKLNLGGTAINNLPESIWKLKYLESLDLSFCRNLTKFPEISDRMELLVEIKLYGTEIEELPKSIDNLPCLKILCLGSDEDCGCNRIIRFLPNSLCKLSQLQVLDLGQCSSLEELPPLPHGLEVLDIQKCERLKSLPELPSSLCSLYANGCSSLEELPLLPHGLGYMNIGKCERLKSLPELPSSLSGLLAEECSSLEELPPLPHGSELLNIQKCERLKSLPELPSSLYYLIAKECSSLEELPPLPHGLGVLDIRKCERLKSLPELPSSLPYLFAAECSSLEELPLPHGLRLRSLIIRKCERLKSLPELPSSLSDLFAEECSSLEELPPLPHGLEVLDIQKCERLKSLPELPSSLSHLVAEECSSLEELPPLPHGLEVLDIQKCERLKSLPELPSSFSSLDARGCSSLEELAPLPHGLEVLDIGKCERLKSLPELPSSLFNLDASGCSSLEELPPLPHGLEVLDIGKCERLKSLPELPSSLFNLDASGCSSLEELPPLPHGLGVLDIRKCERLKSLPELPSSLYYLIAKECTSLEELPPLPHGLEVLDIRKCERLKSLPELPSSLSDLFAEECSSLEELPPLPHGLDELDIQKCGRLKSIAELPSSLSVLKARDCTSLETISRWGYAATQKQFYSDRFFLFENCIKLDDNTLSNVIAYHVRHLIFSAENKTTCVYPGAEIPEWFNYQPGGQDSINIHLPPNWFKLGLRFSICFVNVVLNGYYNQPIQVEYEFNFKAKTSNGDDLLYKHGGALIELDGSINDSDHVLISTQPCNFEEFFWPISDDELLEVFGPNWSSICHNISEASFRVFHKDQNGVIMNIKKFGIHLHNYGFEEPNVDGDNISKRGFDECSSDQPNGYQHNNDSHPRKRIKLMG